jgi:hypothetical protein
LDNDLAAAARRALKLDPAACRTRALKSGWDISSRLFEGNLTACREASAEPAAPAWETVQGSPP